MLRKILSIKSYYRKYGFRVTISTLANILLRWLGFLDQIHLTKRKIIVDGDELFGSKVAYGIFSGMVLPKDIWWTENDRFVKLAGEYEAHVADKLAILAKKYKHFIDIGAADGYFAVGLLQAKLFETCTCFEISMKGREVIASNAKLNGVSDQIEILQEGNCETIKAVISKFGPSAVLCDIEGAEFDLFDETLLQALSDSTVIMELHDDVIDYYKDSRDGLIRRARSTFDITFLMRHNPRVNELLELETWSDIKRLLAFDECRPRRMNWLLLTPKSGGTNLN